MNVRCLFKWLQQLDEAVPPQRDLGLPIMSFQIFSIDLVVSEARVTLPNLCPQRNNVDCNLQMFFILLFFKLLSLFINKQKK